MTNYIGFSTVNANLPRTTNPRVPSADYGSASVVKPLVFGKKFRMTDSQLVIQDLVNALNIRQGQKVGQPGYGTKLWDFVFEPNTYDILVRLETEVRRVANSDPRIELNYVKGYPKENGILVEVEMSITPYNEPLTLSVFFNSETNIAQLQNQNA